MKASDITDEAFIHAVILCCATRKMVSATRWDVATVLAGHPELVETPMAVQDWPNMPPKVVMAKAKRLMARGLLEGCACGCRGDYEVRPTVSERAGELKGAGIPFSVRWERAQRELWARADGAR